MSYTQYLKNRTNKMRDIIEIFTIMFWLFNLWITIEFNFRSHPAGRYWYYRWNRDNFLIFVHIASLVLTILIPFLYFILKNDTFLL